MKISNGNYLSINEIADRYLNFSGTAQAPEKSGEEKSFAEILSDKRSVLEAASGLNFSKHAAERLSMRNIRMNALHSFPMPQRFLGFFSFFAYIVVCSNTFDQ